MKSLLFLLALPLMAAPSAVSFEAQESEVILSPMMAAKEDEKEEDPAVGAWIGGGLVTVAGIGAGVTVFNNKNRVMNEPRKEKKKKDKQDLQ